MSHAPLMDRPAPPPSALAPRMPLARDMARVFAAKRLMQKATTPAIQEDYGRAAQSGWIANYTNTVRADVDIQPVTPWAYRLTPPNADARTVHFIHGGGLVHYDMADFLPMLSHLAARAGTPVMLHGYSKRPEADVEQCLPPLVARISAALDPSGRDILMGDSVGGLLALHIAARPDAPDVRHAVLVYPVLSLDTEFPSYAEFGTAHGLDADTMLWFRSLWADWFKANGPDPLTLTHAPCPITVFAAPCDVLADEAHVFAQRCSGASVQWLEGQAHDCLLYAGRVPSADHALSRISAHLACL